LTRDGLTTRSILIGLLRTLSIVPSASIIGWNIATPRCATEFGAISSKMQVTNGPKSQPRQLRFGLGDIG
jgi:hypothetical protein